MLKDIYPQRRLLQILTIFNTTKSWRLKNEISEISTLCPNAEQFNKKKIFFTIMVNWSTSIQVIETPFIFIDINFDYVAITKFLIN